MTKHLYRGDCPDESQPNCRDQECEACREEDALRRDAERYRWLRNESGNDIASPYVCGVHGAPMGDAGWLTGEWLDEAVDKAMAVADNALS